MGHCMSLGRTASICNVVTIHYVICRLQIIVARKLCVPGTHENLLLHMQVGIVSDYDLLSLDAVSGKMQV